jgi:hypothetical protein
LRPSPHPECILRRPPYWQLWLISTSLYRSRPTHQMSIGPEQSSHKTQCGRQRNDDRGRWQFRCDLPICGLLHRPWLAHQMSIGHQHQFTIAATGGVGSPGSVHVTSTNGATTPGGSASNSGSFRTLLQVIKLWPSTLLFWECGYPGSRFAADNSGDDSPRQDVRCADSGSQFLFF